VGPLQYSSPPHSRQCVSRREPQPGGCRRCLLKGCERWFRPPHPQSRYCSSICTLAARRWRRWRAAMTYRASDPGKQRRREQSQRYRQQRRRPPDDPQHLTLPSQPPQTASPLPSQLPSPEPSSEPPSHQLSVPEPVFEPSPQSPATPLSPESPPCEGQRPATNPHNFSGCPCYRPGCYELFATSARSPEQRFCSSLCRQALRRVVQRETRRHARQRQQHQPRPTGPRPPPRYGS
jgi:hypothetical protein